MTTGNTTLLGLALPVTGELSGSWGDTVNDSITSLVDSAVAGTTTLSTDADVTLTTTVLAANQARQAILNCTGARAVLRTITAPAQSKEYVIINGTTGGFGVKIVGAGPTTGVTVAAGDTAVVAWNGTDFVLIGVNKDAAQTLTNKTVNLTSNTLTGTVAQFNAALSDGDFATLAGSETLTNKTLTSPTLTTPALGTPTSGDATNLTNTIAPQTHAATSKATPVDADELPLSDSAATWGLKKLTWANIKATLLTWLQGTVFPSPGAIGATTPAVGSFTTLISTGNLDVGGAANHTISLARGVDGVKSGSLGFDATDTNLVFASAGGGGTVTVQADGAVTRGVFSSTGLAVTGALSATGGIASNTAAAGVVGLVNLQRNGANKATFALDGSDNFCIYNAAGSVQNVTLTDSGNLGLGVTPSAWGGQKAIDLGAYASVYGGSANLGIASNIYYNGANWIYKNTAAASLLNLTSGGLVLYTTPSGTAAASATLTQSLAVNKGTSLALEGATSAAGTGIAFPATQLASSDANTLDDYLEATYTATATGMTTSPTGTAKFVKVGNNVTLEIPAITGTSNATTFTLTGGPTTMRPSADRTVVCAVKDNSGSLAWGTAVISSAGVISLFLSPQGTGFTASGTKATATTNVSYII